MKLFSFSLLIALTACHTYTDSPTEFGHIEGVVNDSSGMPLSGITVEFGGQVIESDENGRFVLENNENQPLMNIRLHGPEGTGRYRLKADQYDGLVVLEYPEITKVVLLHDNDLHFNYNHREKFISRVEEYREQYENVWLLNAGDTFVRHVHRWAVNDTSYYDEMSRAIITTMNEVGYDASAPGNHEMDYIGDVTGQSLLLADFPFIAANSNIATTKIPQVQPFVVFETTNGLSIAVIGHTTGNYSEKGVTVNNPVETTLKYMKLREDHDLFVALTHIGLSNDKALAEGVPDLDVIIGGHSHTLLEEAIEVNGVLIAQAGGPPPQHQVDPEWPKYLGKVKILLKNGEVVEKSGRVETFKATSQESDESFSEALQAN